MMTARVYCSLSVVLLCLSVCLSTAHAGVAVSGQCPAKLMGALARRGCTSDRDCSGGHICCSYPCGHVCVPPVFTGLPKPPAKPAKTSNPGILGLLGASHSCRDDFA
ncbi:WAP four-disulfide core domain protein 18-like [Rhinichthys klamathensis goyatoka]|uniref:WAP four-disulfide core domain protein 18-like n=1 Tax=Rhinichthys klamathensis goyatoka TaxID=3034132 RepID=UPI0024B4F858|nr:WAP four-disulfide core domain protein 18-like [Rhinichthys klamathensis goyatoka]